MSLGGTFRLQSQDLRFNISKKEAFVSTVLPTYDERENIGPLLSGFHAELQRMWSAFVIESTANHST